MQKKHLCLSLLLLPYAQIHSIKQSDWMHEMMQEMEESFTRMQEGFSRMHEAFVHMPAHSVKSNAGLHFGIEKQQDNIVLSLHNVQEGTIDAQFDENVLRLKHPLFSAYIRQSKDRLNRAMLSITLEYELSVAQEEGKKSFKQSSFSSSMETISIEKPVLLDEPAIMYDEAKKELTVTLAYKTQKNIPITVKKAE